jgi:hypothetical protein
LAVFALGMTAVAYCQAAPPVVTGNQPVDKLLSQMTLEEKISLITSHGQAGYIAGIPRLGIPSLCMSLGIDLVLELFININRDITNQVRGLDSLVQSFSVAIIA